MLATRVVGRDRSWARFVPHWRRRPSAGGASASSSEKRASASPVWHAAPFEALFQVTRMDADGEPEGTKLAVLDQAVDHTRWQGEVTGSRFGVEPLVVLLHSVRR